MIAFLRISLTLLFIANLSAGHASRSALGPFSNTLKVEQNGAALWLENQGRTSVAVHIRVIVCEPLPGQGHDADQGKVIATPSLATVQPGQRQRIHFLRIKPAAAGTEQTYYIIIDEVPEVAPSGTLSPTRFHLQMRYPLPLFLDSGGTLTKARHDEQHAPSPPPDRSSVERIGRGNSLSLLTL
ncbi:TPA: molecular chaperone [Serratia marcescens]|nr:molecular chaperone [Serratia marcescens]